MGEPYLAMSKEKVAGPVPKKKFFELSNKEENAIAQELIRSTKESRKGTSVAMGKAPRMPSKAKKSAMSKISMPWRPMRDFLLAI
jgi:hypothetical protein